VNGPEGCPICRGGGPREVLAEMEASWLTAGPAAPMPGYCCLFFRRHAVELHDLTADEGAAFMRDVQRVSRAIQASTGVAKMNYEVHGNTLRHLHMHFFPRYPGDAFEGRPIDPRSVRHEVYAPGALAEFHRRMLHALADDPPGPV
jgi:diadenosine tetraphosphate (Ap4A) HIT family hydrolase